MKINEYHAKRDYKLQPYKYKPLEILGKSKKYFIDPETGCYSAIIRFLRETTEIIRHPKKQEQCEGYSKFSVTYMSQNIRQEKI